MWNKLYFLLLYLSRISQKLLVRNYIFYLEDNFCRRIFSLRAPSQDGRSEGGTGPVTNLCSHGQAHRRKLNWRVSEWEFRTQQYIHLCWSTSDREPTTMKAHFSTKGVRIGLRLFLLLRRELACLITPILAPILETTVLSFIFFYIF